MRSKLIALMVLLGGVLWAQDPPACVVGLNPATVCRITLVFDTTGEVFDNLEAARTQSFVDQSDPANPVPKHSSVAAMLQASLDEAMAQAMLLHPTAAVQKSIDDLRAQELKSEQEIRDSVKVER